MFVPRNSVNGPRKNYIIRMWIIHNTTARATHNSNVYTPQYTIRSVYDASMVCGEFNGLEVVDISSVFHRTLRHFTGFQFMIPYATNDSSRYLHLFFCSPEGGVCPLPLSGVSPQMEMMIKRWLVDTSSAHQQQNLFKLPRQGGLCRVQRVDFHVFLFCSQSFG